MICFIVVIFGIVCVIRAHLKYDDDYILVSVVVPIALMGIILLYAAYTNEINIKEEKAALEKAEQDEYKVFIDSKEVDWNSLDFSMYEVKINTEKKAVYCTKKIRTKE